MALKSKSLRPSRGQWLYIVLALLSLYLILPQVGIFQDSLDHLSGANWQYLSLAFMSAIMTNFMAAITYGLLAKSRLRYTKTLIVQFAGNFVNRLLPAGIGGIGINYAYLRANKHSLAESASVVAANNFLGAVGHFSLIAFILLVLRSNIDGIQLPSPHFDQVWRYVATLLITVAIIVVLRHFRKRIISSLRDVVSQLFNYRKHPITLVLSLFSSIGLTFFNVLSLYYCALGLHFHLSLVSMLIAFTFGVALGTATPTPGGLGGVDAGLVFGLVAFHIPVASALAITLIYRLISCWLPVILGAGIFYITEKKGFYKV